MDRFPTGSSIGAKFKKKQRVFTNCYVGNKEDDKSFLCRGVVTDIIDHKVMKILITGVNTMTLGDPVSNRVLKTLLGKTVPRNIDQANSTMSILAEKLYSQGSWLSWDEEKIKRILAQQKEKKKDETSRGRDQPRGTKEGLHSVPGDEREKSQRNVQAPKQKDRRRRTKDRKARARPGPPATRNPTTPSKT